MSHLAANKDFLRDAFKGKNYLETVMLNVLKVRIQFNMQSTIES